MFRNVSAKKKKKKKSKFQGENLCCDMFLITAHKIDCGDSIEPPHRGGSVDYPQSMFLSRYRKNNVYPCKSQSYYIKVGFEGVKIM